MMEKNKVVDREDDDDDEEEEKSSSRIQSVPQALEAAGASQSARARARLVPPAAARADDERAGWHERISRQSSHVTAMRMARAGSLTPEH